LQTSALNKDTIHGITVRLAHAKTACVRTVADMSVGNQRLEAGDDDVGRHRT